MISEIEIIAQVRRLEGPILHKWIAFGWLRPERDKTGYLFDEADVARARLLCDLCYDMEIKDEELGLVLSLVDQLNDTRRFLRAMADAIREQPEEVRGGIMMRVQALLSVR